MGGLTAFLYIGTINDSYQSLGVFFFVPTDPLSFVNTDVNTAFIRGREGQTMCLISFQKTYLLPFRMDGWYLPALVHMQAGLIKMLRKVPCPTLYPTLLRVNP